jgi:ribonuclease J
VEKFASECLLTEKLMATTRKEIFMGTRRVKTAATDDLSKRSAAARGRKNTGNSVLDKANTKVADVLRAQRRTSDDVNARASQHIIGVPVNRSALNGLGGEQYSPAKMRNKKPAHDALKIIQIGGAGEIGIGKNCIAFEYKDEIIIVDIGVLFPPEADYPGINYMIPDVGYLEARKDKVKAIAITHGHLDHIGAARHILPKFPGVPVYGTKYTTGLIERQMEEETDVEYEPNFKIAEPERHEHFQVSENFSLEFIHVNHSIPGATAIVIRTPLGNIYHSGDWRFEENPVDGKKFDLERVSEIATIEGFLVMLDEATNVESEGTHMHGELDIKASIGQVMDLFPKSRIIFSSFSSQIMRLQCAIDEAAAHGRKIAVAGYSMINNLELAIKQSLVKVPKGALVKIEDLVKLPDSQFMLLCTGSQGELNAVLNRMASGAHRHIKIKGNDVVVFSSNPIPGNEPFVVRTVDGLMREGSDVLRNRMTAQYGVGPLHLSGHAYYDDHVKLINIINPKYYIPIYGEYHMLVNGGEMANLACGIPKENIFVVDDGDVLEFSPSGARRAARVQVGGVMYDSEGTVVSEVVLKDRIHMSNEGIFNVVVTLEKGTGRMLSSPDIVSRGFIYLRDSEELMHSVRQYLRQKIQSVYRRKRSNLDDLKKEMREEISYLLYDKTGRTPIVIPVVNEINVTAPRTLPEKKIDTGENSSRGYIAPPLRRPREDADDQPLPRRPIPVGRQAEFARRAAEVGRVYKTNLPKTVIGQPSRKPGAENISFKKKPTGPGVASRLREDKLF